MVNFSEFSIHSQLVSGTIVAALAEAYPETLKRNISIQAI